MSAQHEIVELPAALTAELAALEPELTTYEARQAAINGQGGIRARYNARLNQLGRAGNASQALCSRIGDDVGRQCDHFMAAILPPADSGLYVGIPRN